MYFIVGIGRSGTSLLQSILHEYTELSVYPESQLVRRSLAFSKNMPLNYEEFMESLSLNNPRWINLKSKLNVLESIEIKAPSEYLDSCINNSQDAVIKDARNIDYIREITEMAPGSKFILIVRDFHRTLLSRKNVDFSSRWGALGNIIIMAYQMESIRRFKFDSKSDVRLYVIKYENLITHDYPPFLKNLLSVDKVESIKSSRELFSESELANHKSRNIGNIQSKGGTSDSLTKIESVLLNIFLYQSMIKYGYSKPNSLKELRLFGITASFLIVFTWPIYKSFSLYRDKIYFK